MNFTFQPLSIPDLVLVTPKRFADDRGFFMECFRENLFAAAGMPAFVQDNHAMSKKNVLRGLHYQLNPAGMGKLVRCLRGRIFDVAVDIRKGSPTYGRWLGLELSDHHPQMFYIPPGFAHGYCAMSGHCEVFYRTTAYYSPDHERAIRWDDPHIGIKWPVASPVLSPKDRRAPLMHDAENNFGADT